jgi:sugar phosphate isomerase/epimerase
MDGDAEMNESRRALLKAGIQSAAAVAAAQCFEAWRTPLAVLGATESARQPKLCFPTAPRDRLAVTSYPFRAYIDAPGNRGRDPDKPGMTLLEFPRQMIERFGIYNINPVIEHFASTDAAYLDSLREAVWEAGSHFVDLGLNGGHFYDPDADERAKAVAGGKKGVDVALGVGSPSVRQHVDGRHGTQPNVELAAESLGRLADYGSHRNIVINLENDDIVTENPFFLVQVIEKVDNPYLRALPDFGNSIREHGQEYNERALRKMFAHAFNMSHVKEYVREDSGKEDHINLADIFSIARASHYQGYFSMEYDSGSGDPYQGTQNLVDMTLKYLSSSS